MKKIRITKITGAVYTMRGFDEKGCYDHPCEDACCLDGCEVDKEAYDLIFEYRELVERRTGVKLENCFKKAWRHDDEFLGGNSIDTRIGRNGYCTFHNPGGKGCVLYDLVEEKNLPRRIIPSICRLYPLTWGCGTLCISDYLEPTCNCLARSNRTSKTLLETQKGEIEDIFKIDDGLLREAT
jgi:hypothetical protein